MLQGLFHKRVAITESDADCRFYGAVVDVLGTQAGKQSVANDLLFVPSGGKSRVASMARSLSELGVEVFAILDFDALRTKQDIVDVVEAVGETWTQAMQDDYVALATRANGKNLWESLKHQGLSGVPAGPAYQATERLLNDLQQIRVLIVRVGEMECFDKSSNLHGATWVSEMLEAHKHETNDEAQKLIQPLLGESSFMTQVNQHRSFATFPTGFQPSLCEHFRPSRPGAEHERFGDVPGRRGRPVVWLIVGRRD